MLYHTCTTPFFPTVFIILLFFFMNPFSIYAKQNRIKDRQDVEQLIAALQDMNPSVRAEAAAALGNIKDTRAVEPLIAALEDASIFAGYENTGVKAAQALGKIKDTRALNPLVEALKSDLPRNWEFRLETARALGKMKNTRAVDLMLAALPNMSVDGQCATILTLYTIKDKRIEHALKRFSKEVELKKISKEYWLYLRDESAEPFLILALLKYGHKNMAKDFLNSQNTRLEEAGEIWAKSHGMEIIIFQTFPSGTTLQYRR